jgi:hypothetical protein
VSLAAGEAVDILNTADAAAKAAQERVLAQHVITVLSAVRFVLDSRDYFTMVIESVFNVG